MERRRDGEGEKKGKIGKLTWHPAIVIYLIPLTEHAAKLTETRSRMIFMVLQETASHSVKKGGKMLPLTDELKAFCGKTMRG